MLFEEKILFTNSIFNVFDKFCSIISINMQILDQNSKGFKKIEIFSKIKINPFEVFF